MDMEPQPGHFNSSSLPGFSFAHAGEEIGIYNVTYPSFIYAGYQPYFGAGANEGARP